MRTGYSGASTLVLVLALVLLPGCVGVPFQDFQIPISNGKIVVLDQNKMMRIRTELVALCSSYSLVNVDSTVSQDISQGVWLYYTTAPEVAPESRFTVIVERGRNAVYVQIKEGINLPEPPLAAKFRGSLSKLLEAIVGRENVNYAFHHGLIY